MLLWHRKGGGRGVRGGPFHATSNAAAGLCQAAFQAAFHHAFVLVLLH